MEVKTRPFDELMTGQCSFCKFSHISTRAASAAVSGSFPWQEVF
jgi:hypothetical protein